MICYKTAAREVPSNYILLFSYTFSMTFILSFICSMYDPKVVTSACIMTIAIALALTLYAMTAKADFSKCIAFMFCFVIIMLIMTILLCFFNTRVAYTLYCVTGVLLYSLFIIIDTMLICGGKRYGLSIDDYIFAALILYIDIIQLFLEILRLLGNRWI